MAATVHRVPPLRLHDADRTQVAFDLGGRGIMGKNGLVNEQRFVLDRSIWCEAVGWDLVLEDFEVFEGGYFDGHRGLTVFSAAV
jgi:hypothetical protein